MLDLVIQNQQKDTELPAEDFLVSCAAAAFLGDNAAQVTLRVVDEEESADLNEAYRGKNKPTNVLSFPMDMPAEFLDVLDLVMLGDLVVCASVVSDEARQQGKTEKAHWAHMLVHGMLHLQGYDHISDADAETMEKLEIKLLSQLGFDDPYRLQSEHNEE
ncbi:MAG: rRNA maturation RNase YbeY [Gammaproteobacteria bacterium]|nr:rRNA maturation RNase YbeY [Gammaproteobacteria bacterium]